MNKKGLLIVSFGTSYRDALARDIVPVEEAIAAAFPGYTVRRAFGSKMIIRKLLQRDQVQTLTAAEALAEFAADGIRQVVIQPTFLIHGIEYDLLKDTVAACRQNFDSIRIGKPLLASPEDYITLAEALDRLHPQEKGTLVLMGHGTDHYANAAYPAFETVLRRCGHTHILVGAVEGYPEIGQIAQQLKSEDIRNATLMPLMLVAGDHANNDMASDEPDSWKSILADLGIRSECVLQGLGSRDFVQRMFAEHALQAQEI